MTIDTSHAALAAERDALLAEVERLRENHPHSWWTVQEHFARRRADGLARELDDMRAKLQAANLRANAAEARANAIRAKWEAAQK